MTIGFAMCSVLCVLFLFFAVIFAILKEKAAILISGFNTLPKEKRKLYDQKKMSRDQRNSFLIWAGITGAGAVLSYFLSGYWGIAATIIWLILFFKDVHMDAERAFRKYKK